MTDSSDSLSQIATEVSACEKCKLHATRKKAVPGEGPATAKIMFVGEGPGFHENEQGRPFVGAAGKFLSDLLASIGMKREEVFITNVVKCFISPRVKVYTAEGYKPIKDIKVGDLVLTHTGKFRPVTYVRPRENLPVGSPVVEIVVRPADGEHRRRVRLTVTPEHPFMVNGRWTPAAEIQADDAIRVLGDPGPETRQKIRGVMARQYAEGLRDPVAITARANAKTREWAAAGRARAQHFSSEWEKIIDQPGMTRAILERLLKNHRGEYTYVEARVEKVTWRHTRRPFPLYNIGVEADESYVAAGVVSHNCRPPQNRDPETDELKACGDFLERQIALIDPAVIVTLGRFSMERFFPGAKISNIHGQARTMGGRLVVAMFHPAAALHQPQYRSLIEQDFKKLPEYMARAEATQTAVRDTGDDDIQQLSLF